MLVPTAVSCPPTKIPNSDKADELTGKANEKFSVTCNGATKPFAVLCIGIAPGRAIWTGFAPCPGVFRSKKPHVMQQAMVRFSIHISCDVSSSDCGSRQDLFQLRKQGNGDCGHYL